jgi:hypothetical protein
MAVFLGDPMFPQKAMRERSRGLRISWFQDLYKQYSRLGFTRYDDRPFAIAGLEKRLLRAFGTKGGFGIFDDGDKLNGGLFHRSLLWQRGEETGDAPSLKLIVYSADKNIRVPSWSWMAYEGGIDYISPPFQGADWETKEIVPPWTRGSTTVADSAPHEGDIVLTAVVRDFNVAGWQRGEVKLTYDAERKSTSLGKRTQCVIVAREKIGRSDEDKRHYVLLVVSTQVATGRRERPYKRVGAGFMLGKHIVLDGPGIAAKIY